MHNKAVKFLLTRHDTIIIGNVSTKNMVSKLKGNLRKIVKKEINDIVTLWISSEINRNDQKIQSKHNRDG